MPNVTEAFTLTPSALPCSPLPFRFLLCTSCQWCEALLPLTRAPQDVSGAFLPCAIPRPRNFHKCTFHVTCGMYQGSCPMTHVVYMSPCRLRSSYVLRLYTLPCASSNSSSTSGWKPPLAFSYQT